MKQLVAATLVLAASLWALSAWEGAGVAADAPVDVLTAESVLLRLPQTPTTQRIVSDLTAELEEIASQESDPRVSAALRRIAADGELLRIVASAPVDLFSNRQAAATATPIYDVSLDDDAVVVTVVTVELVAGYGSTAVSHDHEDGHAAINSSIAERCAADALAAAIGSGRRGDVVADAIIDSLAAATAPVHAVYHQYVANARYGEHRRYAEQALAAVSGCA